MDAYMEVSPSGKSIGDKRDNKGCKKEKFEAEMKNNIVPPKVCINSNSNEKSHPTLASNQVLYTNNHHTIKVEDQQESGVQTFTASQPQALSVCQHQPGSLNHKCPSTVCISPTKLDCSNMAHSDKTKLNQPRVVLKTIEPPDVTVFRKCQTDIVPKKVVQHVPSRGVTDNILNIEREMNIKDNVVKFTEPKTQALSVCQHQPGSLDQKCPSTVCISPTKLDCSNMAHSDKTELNQPRVVLKTIEPPDVTFSKIRKCQTDIVPKKVVQQVPSRGVTDNISNVERERNIKDNVDKFTEPKTKALSVCQHQPGSLDQKCPSTVCISPSKLVCSNMAHSDKTELNQPRVGLTTIGPPDLMVCKIRKEADIVQNKVVEQVPSTGETDKSLKIGRERNALKDRLDTFTEPQTTTLSVCQHQPGSSNQKSPSTVCISPSNPVCSENTKLDQATVVSKTIERSDAKQLCKTKLLNKFSQGGETDNTKNENIKKEMNRKDPVDMFTESESHALSVYQHQPGSLNTKSPSAVPISLSNMVCSDETKLNQFRFVIEPHDVTYFNTRKHETDSAQKKVISKKRKLTQVPSRGKTGDLNNVNINKREINKKEPFAEPESQALSVYQCQPGSSNTKSPLTVPISSSNMVCPIKTTLNQARVLSKTIKLPFEPKVIRKSFKLEKAPPRKKTGDRKNVSNKRDANKICIPAKQEARKSILQRERHSKHKLLQRVHQIKNNVEQNSNDLYPLGLELSDSDSDDLDNNKAIYQHHWFSNIDIITDDMPREQRVEASMTQTRRRLAQTLNGLKVSEEPDSEMVSAVVAAARRFPNATAAILNPSIAKPAPELPKDAQFQTTGAKCGYSGGCNLQALPCTRHCIEHIMYNAHQWLFQYCTARGPDNTHCNRPVFDIRHESPLCPQHVPQDSLVRSHPEQRRRKKVKKNNHYPLLSRKRKSNNKNRKKSVSHSTERLAVDRMATPSPLPLPSSPPQSGEFPEEVSEEVLANTSIDLGEVSQASSFLGDLDFTSIFSQISTDAFNDLIADLNGELEPTGEDTEELERALTAVDNDVSFESIGSLDQILLCDLYTINNESQDII